MLLGALRRIRKIRIMHMDINQQITESGLDIVALISRPNG